MAYPLHTCVSGLIGQLHSGSDAWAEKSFAQSWYEIPVSVVHLEERQDARTSQERDIYVDDSHSDYGVRCETRNSSASA